MWLVVPLVAFVASITGVKAVMFECAVFGWREGSLSLIVCVNYCYKEGLVYAVEFSPRSGRDLVAMAKKRPNIIPIVEDARHPHKYRMLVGQCPQRLVGRVAHCTYQYLS